MKGKILALAVLGGLLAGCATSQGKMTGNDRDAHGCIGSAGYSYSFLRGECVQPFEVAQARLDDPDNDTLAIYLLFSGDKKLVEVFGANLPENRVLQQNPSGYASKDGKIRFVRGVKGLKLVK